MRYLLLAALVASVTPGSALACAMPRMDERELAKLMADIDQAAVAPVAPAPVVAPAVAPPAPAAVVAPAAVAPVAPRAKSASPTSVIPEVAPQPES